jgi:PAS domain S-box-containing protein
MNAADIAIPVGPLSLDDTIGAALTLMHARGADMAPVADSSGRLLGAVTRSDLFTAVSGGAFLKASVAGRMINNPPRVSSSDELLQIPASSIPALVFDGDGTLAGVLSLERYSAGLRESLTEFREQVASVMNSAESGIIAVDVDGKLVMANRMAEVLLGINAEDTIGNSIQDIIPGTRLLEIIKSGKPLTGQKFEGLGVSLIVNYAPVKRGGKVTGAVSVFHDISLLNNISQELEVVKGLNRELEAVIHSSYDGIWITDAEGRVLDINEAYERITGINAREVIGRTMHELVENGYFDKSVTILVMKELRSITINQTVKGKKQILVTGNPIFDSDGKLFRVVTNVRDITELVTLKEQLTLEKEQALKYKTELTHLRSLQIRDSDLIFRSKQMTEVVELSVKMADVDSTLLITGESGTGKEIVAKLVHRRGKGDGCPFISINCAAIPEQLLESELFGYEGGAFTGAKKEGKPGLFELAHNGTLFLDEVAELPLALQVKLLRAIQDKEITRVGATKGIAIKVRIIAATNRNLADMMKAGTFREDLYYRLMVVPIHVAPLRERKEDVPLLIRHYLDEFNRHFGYSKTLSPSVLDKLVNYNWPGNVRELKNLIERMIVMSPGQEINLESLPDAIYVRKRLPKQGARLKDALEETERYLIEETYREHKSWKKVAEVLGVDRTTVFRKAVKYRLTNR